MKTNKAKARLAVARHTTHGISKSDAKNNGKISSIGSERNYRQCIYNYIEWCDVNNISPDFRANNSSLKAFLDERSEYVQQKTLDQERRSLELIYKQDLPYFCSQQISVYEKRSYTLTEVKAIVVHQCHKNVITTWLAFFCGLRAHEAATLLPIAERQASHHRDWDPRRFTGLDQFAIYTVQGKGGLVREVAIPTWLSHMLEATKRVSPIEIVDREIMYLSFYDIGIGQSWSQSFSAASKKALKFSRGGHGLRHSYAKWRLKILMVKLEEINQSAVDEQALLILSQELGHFRLDIVYCYLR